MNKRLWQRVESLLNEQGRAILATCGSAEPKASLVSYRLHGIGVYAFVPSTSDHLFHLEQQPNVVLLSSAWELHGRGQVVQKSAYSPPHDWQSVVGIQPVRFHILTAEGLGYAETLDFESLEGES